MAHLAFVPSSGTNDEISAEDVNEATVDCRPDVIEFGDECVLEPVDKAL